jgi:hypothetical protein
MYHFVCTDQKTPNDNEAYRSLHLRVLSMKLASYHLSGHLEFGSGPEVFERFVVLCHPVNVTPARDHPVTDM